MKAKALGVSLQSRLGECGLCSSQCYSAMLSATGSQARVGRCTGPAGCTLSPSPDDHFVHSSLTCTCKTVPSTPGKCLDEPYLVFQLLVNRK